MPKRVQNRMIVKGAAAVATATGAAALSLAGVEGLIAGAAAAPVVTAGIDALIDRWTARQHLRVSEVVARAAQAAGLPPSQLLERLRAAPEREELVIRTLRAAADTPAELKLVAFATSVAVVATREPAAVAWEALFVRALSDLDLAHLDVLRRFTWSANDLGLGDGRSAEFDKRVEYLNARQVEIALPSLQGTVGVLLAALVRHGLLDTSTPTLGTFGGGGGTMQQWTMSAFGRAFLARIELVHRVLTAEA